MPSNDILEALIHAIPEEVFKLKKLPKKKRRCWTWGCWKNWQSSKKESEK